VTFRSELAAEPWRFDLFAVLRRLERENPGKPRIGDARSLADEFVTICQDPYMDFPDSNLEGAEIGTSGRIRLKAKFLGMFGPQGALPLTTTEEAYGWLRERDDAFPRFVDIFQRRFLALFYRAWADARPIAQNDRPEQDRFLAYIGSMIGIGTLAFRDADSISDFAKLPYAGLLAPRVKSASRLRAFLSSLLGTRVEIDEFVGSWLEFDPNERTRVGQANARIGEDCVAGASMYSVSDKIRLRVYVRDIKHFRRFLPGSALALEIADAVFLYVGEEYDWDMELAIPAGEITAVRLGQDIQLGWTSWMSPNWSKTDETIRRDARFHVVSRLVPQRTASDANCVGGNHGRGH
jgi:type VI secretion system protein ImpH